MVAAIWSNLVKEKIKASHKMWIAVDNYFIKTYKMMILNIAFEVTLSEGNFQSFSF